jgi:hypothetical protein
MKRRLIAVVVSASILAGSGGVAMATAVSASPTQLRICPPGFSPVPNSNPIVCVHNGNGDRIRRF